MSCRYCNTALPIEAQPAETWRENRADWYAAMAGQEGVKGDDTSETCGETRFHEPLSAAFNRYTTERIGQQIMDKVQIIVTGATGSMGSEAVRALAKKGHSVIMACRNLEKGEAVKKSILEEMPAAELQLMQADLASLSSVVSFTDALKEQGVALSGLFNNAGVMNRRYGLTVDGFERTLAVNFLAPYLLTRRLIPLFTPDAHVVNMISLTCHLGHVGRDLFEKGPKDFRQLGAYGDSKLALLLFTIALSRRVRFHVNMADPGVVNSNMIHMDRWYDGLADVVFRPFCKSPAKGVVPALNALATEETLHFFNGNRCREVPGKYMSHQDIDWLWEITEVELRKKDFSCY